jgi:hypothetical protein
MRNLAEITAKRKASIEHTAAHSWFVVRKYEYLKTTRYSVWIENDQDGGSGAGEFRTLKSAAGHIWSSFRDVVTVNPSMRVVVETWHGFDADGKPITTTETTDADAFLSRTGVTRKG